MLSFPLCCMVFGILVFCPKTDGGSLTWQQPLPIQTIQSSNLEDHFSSRQLLEGTINATLNWQFSLNQLNFLSLVILLNGTPVAGVRSSGTGPQAGFENEFGIDWNLNQKLVKLFIFKVTTEKNDTFTCQVNVEEVTGFVTKNFQFTSNVQVHVVDPTNNIVTRTDLDVRAPAELTLNCSADGIPKPTITWTRLSDKTVVTMPLKIIRGKNKESYRCTASNGVGNPLTKDVLVNILFSPKVTLAEKFFVGRGEAASLFCQVEGNPKPTISWSPCDPPLVSCDKQYLNISNVQTARSYFNCTARNNVGIDSATTVLLIGGYNIYLRMGIIEECDKKYSVWEALKKELTNVFEETTQNYSGAELIVASCGSLIFDIVLKFSTEVTEDDTISIIQNATLNGKLGELNINASYIIGIPPVPQTTTAPTSTTPKSDDNTGLIIGVVLGGLAFVALIGFIIWCVRKKKCCSDTKEVSDNTDSAQERKGKGQNRGDEAEYASTSMLPHSKRPVEKTNQGTVQALPMYAQVDKTKKTSNKGGAAQRQRQPGELQYAEVEHVTSGRSLPRKSSSEPIKPSNEEIVYADLV